MSEAIREGDMVLTPGEFGRVVGDGSGPMVVVDHDGHCSVYPLDDVEAVVGVSERDAMRDRAITAEQERDRLRREVEAVDALWEQMCKEQTDAEGRAVDLAVGPMSPAYSRAAGHADAMRSVIARLGAILRGGGS